jgi:hypothetical protein
MDQSWFTKLIGEPQKTLAAKERKMAEEIKKVTQKIGPEEAKKLDPKKINPGIVVEPRQAQSEVEGQRDTCDAWYQCPYCYSWVRPTCTGGSIDYVVCGGCNRMFRV